MNYRVCTSIVFPYSETPNCLSVNIAPPKYSELFNNHLMIIGYNVMFSVMFKNIICSRLSQFYKYIIQHYFSIIISQYASCIIRTLMQLVIHRVMNKCYNFV